LFFNPEKRVFSDAIFGTMPQQFRFGNYPQKLANRKNFKAAAMLKADGPDGRRHIRIRIPHRARFVVLKARQNRRVSVSRQ
jgi:hypothetical protein